MSSAPLRLGILSTARIGARIVTACRNGAATLAGVASRRSDALDAYRSQHELGDEVRSYDSYEALLADDSIEAIYNPLPNALHAEWTIRALEAGKHVLCEKPLASDVGECLQMIRTARAADRVLMEAFMYRYHAGTRELRARVEAGDLGEVRLVRSGFTFNLDNRENIRFSRELSGGATMDVGCYCINFARLVLGAEPVRAYASAEFGPTDVDETLCGTLEFASGAVAQFDCSIRSAGRSFGTVLGSGGQLAIERPWFPKPERHTFLLNGEEVEVLDGGDPYTNEVKAFSRAVRGDESLGPAPLPALDGARNMAALVAILQAARTRQPVDVEPVDEPS